MLAPTHRSSRSGAIAVGLTLAGLLAGCTASPDSPAPTTSPTPGAPASLGTPSAEARLAPLRLRTSLSASGRAWAARTSRPRYDLRATVDPVTGHIAGNLLARLPTPEDGRLTFRFLPGLASLKAAADIGSVSVDGAAVTANLDESLLHVPTSPTSAASVQVEIGFDYVLPLSDEPSGGLLGGAGADLDPAEIGLLARHRGSMNFGHWFPIWIPPGRSAEPTLGGFGDLGNFNPADISVDLVVPEGWSVVDSGIEEDPVALGKGQVSVRSEGAAMRDFSVALAQGWTTRERRLPGLTVTATAPADQADQLDRVLDQAADALRILSQRLGDYPWREFDVVAAPLAASVGGMEWPGGTWIEQDLLAGGIPGLGALGDIDLDAVDPAVLDGLGLGDVLTTLRTALPWTLAHEAAHSWWTLLVGNDSISSPVSDEPLAQYSACLVIRRTMAAPDRVCHAQINDTFTAARKLGVADGVADRPSDAFDSALQYGALVYGKAGAFWLTLEEEFGSGRVLVALRRIVGDFAFGVVDGATLRASLVKSLGQRSGALWDRWMEQVRGDEDLS